MTKPTTIAEVLQRFAIECVEETARHAGKKPLNNTELKPLTYSQTLTTIEQLVTTGVIEVSCPPSCNEGHLMEQDPDGDLFDSGMCSCVQQRQVLKQLMGTDNKVL